MAGNALQRPIEGSISVDRDLTALALLRLDRVAEALDAGIAVLVGTTAVDVDSLAVAQSRQSLANRPVNDL